MSTPKLPDPPVNVNVNEAAQAVALKEQQEAVAKEAALKEQEMAKNKLQLVEEGVNPNAPKVPPTPAQQLKLAQDRLAQHRLQLKSAKEDHEENLEEVRKMRKWLASAENQLVNNDFADLVQQEHDLMATVTILENQIASKQVKADA